MKKFFWILCVSILFANPGTAKSELQWGAGFGLQYAGILGIQGSYRIHKSSLKFSVGLLGISGGAEQLLGDRFSIGYQAFAVGFSTGWGIYGNYYLAGKTSKSWVVGLDFIRNAQTSFITATSEDSNKFLISVGYNF